MGEAAWITAVATAVIAVIAIWGAFGPVRRFGKRLDSIENTQKTMIAFLKRAIPEEAELMDSVIPIQSGRVSTGK